MRRRVIEPDEIDLAILRVLKSGSKNQRQLSFEVEKPYSTLRSRVLNLEDSGLVKSEDTRSCVMLSVTSGGLEVLESYSVRAKA